MRLRHIVLVALVAVTASSCGSRAADTFGGGEGGGGRRGQLEGEASDTASESSTDSSGANDSGAGPSGSQAEGPDGQPRSDEPGAAAKGGAGGAGNSSGSPEAPSGIAKSIEPRCPRRAAAVTVVVETTPFADVTYAASFADGNHHNIFGLSQVGPDGKWVFSFVVPPDAALGDARFIVGAAHTNGGGGRGDAPFRVTQSGAC